MKQKEFTFAHLSDLHLSPDRYPERSVSFRASLDQSMKMGVDHIVITGDITNQARKIEFDHFTEIVNEYGLNDGKKMTVVAGNHDIFGGPYHAEDVLEFPSICKATDYAGRVAAFHRATEKLFAGSQFLSRDAVFPFVKIFGDVAFIGMNSVAHWSAMKNPIGSNGHVDDDQFELVESLLESTVLRGKRIFIAVHHHFSKNEKTPGRSKLERLWKAIEATTMKLRKKKRLLNLFSRTNIEGVLHGHIHHNEEYVRRNVRCFNGGGSVIPSVSGEKMLNIVSVGVSGVALSVVPLIQTVGPVRSKKIRPGQHRLAAA
jgi:3',5'-cyclic AMP phosphodiesterase CpdA